MPSFHEYKRRSLIPLTGLGLLLYYLAVFLPLDHRAKNLDAPLQTAWRRLAASLDQTNSAALDFQSLTNQLSETRQALAQLEKAKREVATRLQLSPALQSKMGGLFQLVDYQNQRSKQMDDLDQQARQQKVTLDAAVFSGFPEYTAETTDPALLWPALAMTDDLLLTALRNKVGAIHSLEVPLTLATYPNGDNFGRWVEIPIQVEFTASADSALQLLQSLPLRAEEIARAGLPPVTEDKAPLFIDRLIIKKQAPEKLDEVRVWVRAIGFVLRE